MSFKAAGNVRTSQAAAEVQPNAMELWSSKEVSPARRDVTPWILAALSMIAFVAALFLTRSINPLSADSPSYLYFDPSRTIGYPAFLWIVKVVTGRPILAVPLQMALLAGSLFLLGWSFHSVAQRPRLSIIFQLLLLCSPELWRSSAKLITEALATASVALWCAQLLMVLKRPSRPALVLLGTIAAGGMLIRPSLVVLFGGCAITALLLEAVRERWTVVISIGAIGFCAWAATPVAYLLIHGSPATGSPFARGVLQHTLFCDQAAVSRDSDAAFVEQDSKLTRTYIDSAPGDVQLALEHLYSSPLRFGSIIPVIARRHHLSEAWQTDPIVLQIAEQRIEANPICYGASVLKAYLELATQDPIHSADLAAKVRQFVAAHPPVQIPTAPLLASDEDSQREAAAELHVAAPRLHDSVEAKFTKTNSPFILAWRILFGSAGVVGLVALAALLWRRRISSDARALTLCLAALGGSFHAMFLLTAIVELALVRYTLPALPIACTLVGLTRIILLRSMANSPASGPFWPRAHAPAA